MLGRFGWFVAILMVVSGFFVARVPDATRPEYAGASAFFVVAFAIPSFWTLWRWLGTARWLQVLAPLSVFAIGIEALAIQTGFPYGYFQYSDKIGAKVAGLVPWTVPFAWTPLVLGAYALTVRGVLPRVLPAESKAKASQALIIFAATLVLMTVDLVLDPGAVLQNFWRYQSPGAYYGVPLSNYFGWLLSGVIGMSWLHFGVHRAKGRNEMDGFCPPIGLMTSLWWILCFWSSVCGWAGLWAPAAIGVALIALILRAAREPAPVAA